MDTFQRLNKLTGTVCVAVICIFSSSMVAEGAMDHQNDGQSEFTEWNTALFVFNCLLISLIFVFFIIINCTDCYNSEVSSECHPAAVGSAPKWGGAGDYTAAVSSDVNRSVMGSGYVGEVVHPDDVTPLPYALIPSQVPEAQGFRGYGTGQPEGVPLMRSYSNSGAQQQSALAGYGGGGGVPPPTLSGYGTGGAVQQPALAGYGGGGGVPPPTLSGYGTGGAVQQPALAGYGGGGGVPPPTLSGYGTGGAVQQPARAGYGGGQGGVQGQGGVGGPPWQGGSNPGGGRGQNLPGAHIPLMTPDPDDAPPPYFTSQDV